MQSRERAKPQEVPRTIEGRVPPHDLDAEAAVLSAIMIDTGDTNRPSALHLVLDVLKPEHFYSEAHRRIYEACLALAEEGKPVDVVQVGTWLKDRERIAQVGGMGYLADVLNAAPAIANVRAYALTVVGKAKARRTISACQHYGALGYVDYGDADTYASDAAEALHAVAHEGTAVDTVHILEVLKTDIRELAEAVKSGARMTGTPTGFTRLDRMTSGVHDGDLTVLAARPGMGKTSLALDLAANVASGAGGTIGAGVVIFSLEMPRKQIARRMSCSEARVDVGKLRSGMLSAEDWSRYTSATKFLGALPIWVNDAPGLTVLEVRAHVRRVQAEIDRLPVPGRDGQPLRHSDGRLVRRRVGLVVIDYLQLMSAKADNREQEISSISRGLKGTAKELNLPVLALSQLNRSVETRGEKNKRPLLSDLRESGAIEQDSDNILFIYRDDYYRGAESDERNIAELIVAKQRNGPTGTVKIRFDREYTRFDNLAEGEYPDDEGAAA